MSNNKGLIVITGPSGVGKGTLVKRLLKEQKNIWLSISATTRLPREGEEDGKDYLFLDKNQFIDLIKENGFLEWAEFAGNFYGTPKSEVKQKLSEGKIVLLEIELEGARQVRKNCPEVFQIFIIPPSFNELEKRIRSRGTESVDAINKRLIRAKEEIKAQNEFDSIVVNDDLEKAFLQIKNIIES